jgi:hypothetical protein
VGSNVFAGWVRVGVGFNGGNACGSRIVRSRETAEGTPAAYVGYFFAELHCFLLTEESYC